MKKEDQTEIKLINKQNFQKIIDDKQVDLFTLKNTHGLVTQITNWGGRVVNLWVPDKHGKFDDVVLGFNTIEEYLKDDKYLGALIGRVGNRIAKGTFELNSSTYTLVTNNGANHLHGGNKGFDSVVWDAHQISDSELELTYYSVDGEEGYPGNLKTKVLYSLTDNNELKICYSATTDKPTPINLTHHSYFNLKGEGKGSINDHVLQINASNFTPVIEGSIPTGEIRPVINTPFDFTKPTAISKNLDEEDEQIILGSGYDLNYVLDGAGLRAVARVEEPKSGRVMEVITDEPGIQFYGGNFLDGKDKGKNGLPHERRAAFCLETQHHPDSVNHPSFPSTILEPGETFLSTCIYRFVDC